MSLSNTQRWTIATALMVLMILTRGVHEGSPVNLPDASWAVFFLAALYLRALLWFPVFMLAAWLTDLSAVNFGAVSAFCMTPAYFMLVPAYGSLWLGGHWYAHLHRDRPATLFPLAGTFAAGVVACELFSSGGFYLFSGYFAELTWAAYLDRTITYFPGFLATAAFYLALVALVHGLVRVCTARKRVDATSAGSGWPAQAATGHAPPRR